MSMFKVGDKVRYYICNQSGIGKILKIINFEDGGCDIYGDSCSGDRYIITCENSVGDIRIIPELIEERNIEAIPVTKEEFAIEILKDLNSFLQNNLNCKGVNNLNKDELLLAVNLTTYRIIQKIKELKEL